MPPSHSIYPLHSSYIAHSIPFPASLSTYTVATSTQINSPSLLPSVNNSPTVSPKTTCTIPSSILFEFISVILLLEFLWFGYTFFIISGSHQFFFYIGDIGDLASRWEVSFRSTARLVLESQPHFFSHLGEHAASSNCRHAFWSQVVWSLWKSVRGYIWAQWPLVSWAPSPLYHNFSLYFSSWGRLHAATAY
jgi:hypothetical protein